jgi:acetoin utilization deacetylase AcuC-like enzyme
MHSERNYPLRKVASDLDIGLPDRAGDDVYLEALRGALSRLLDSARPDIVFYNAGVDPHRNDRLGRLALSEGGIAARDLFVIDAVSSRSIPLAGIIGGGYSDEVEALARLHASLHRTAARFVGDPVTPRPCRDGVPQLRHAACHVMMPALGRPFDATLAR